jgi:hypothetical protein
VVQISYSDLYDIRHDRGYDEEIRQGDLVRTSPNAFPQWEVLAVRGDKAWVLNVQTGQQGITDLARCRRIETPID